MSMTTTSAAMMETFVSFVYVLVQGLTEIWERLDAACFFSVGSGDVL